MNISHRTFRFLYIRDNTLLAVFCSWMTCSWTVRMLCLNNSGELGSWPWWWSESWIVWDMNGCDGFENEKVGNGFSPEIKRWGAGSIYWMIFIMETGDKTSCCLSGAAKAFKSNTYHSLLRCKCFSLHFVVDAHGQGRQFDGVVHGMRALWPDPNGPKFILNSR